MPTELLTVNQARAADESRQSPLTTLKSQQKPTICINDACFDDVLEAINPLNHIPFVSSLRENPELPAEEQNALMPAAKMIGGGLLGGVFGFIGAAVDGIFQQADGKGFFQSILTSVFSDEPDTAAQKAAKAYQNVSLQGASDLNSRGHTLSIES